MGSVSDWWHCKTYPGASSSHMLQEMAFAQNYHPCLSCLLLEEFFLSSKGEFFSSLVQKMHLSVGGCCWSAKCHLAERMLCLILKEWISKDLVLGT